MRRSAEPVQADALCVAAGWLTYVVFITLASVVYGPHLFLVVSDPSWLAGVFVLGPAVGLISVVAGVIVSARVNDPRVAQQIDAWATRVPSPQSVPASTFSRPTRRA